MNSRFVKTLALATIIVGGIWILSNRDKIKEPGDVVDLIRQKIDAAQVAFTSDHQAQDYGTSSGFEPVYPGSISGVQPIKSQRSKQIKNVIRIASFKLNPNVAQQNSQSALELVADICRRYDAIAIQEISASDQTWLPRLIERMNALGAVSLAGSSGPNRSDYSFVSDRDHNTGLPTQTAIVFNRRSLEMEPSQWYTVNDPDKVLTREPLVGWFRTRGPSPEQAFTFSLASVKIGSKDPATELSHLVELFRAIRNDGRGEDDVLIVGDFNAGDQQLQPLRKRGGFTWVVSNRPTTTRHTSQVDNLVFNDTSTVEFTGRGGVFDFLRHYNLRLDDAVQISGHSPVWAEFSIFEGAATQVPVSLSPTVPGRVAEKF